MLRLFALLFLVPLVLLACGKLEEPELKRIENPRVQTIGSNESLLVIDLLYYNPNKSRIQFKSASGNAWLEDRPLGAFTIDTTLTIEPKSDFTLPVRLKIDMSTLLRNSASLLLKNEVLVRIEGTARVGKGGIFIRYPLKYEGKHDLVKILRNLKNTNTNTQ